MAAPNTAVDIRDYLANTVGLSNVYINQLMSAPINAAAVVEYAALRPTKVHGSTDTHATTVLDTCRVQVQIRNSNAGTALSSSLAVVNALDGLMNVTINSRLYTYIELITRPRIISRPEEGAVVYAIEFEVQSRR